MGEVAPLCAPTHLPCANVIASQMRAFSAILHHCAVASFAQACDLAYMFLAKREGRGIYILCAMVSPWKKYARIEAEQSEVHLSRVERGLQLRATSSNKCNKKRKAFRESSRSDLDCLSHSDAR